MLEKAKKYFGFGVFFALFIVLTLFLFTPLFGLFSGELPPYSQSLDLTVPVSPAKGIITFIAGTEAVPDPDSCYFIVEKSGATTTALRAASQPLSDGSPAVSADWDSAPYSDGIYSLTARCSYAGLAQASPAAYFNLSNRSAAGEAPANQGRIVSLDAPQGKVGGKVLLKARTNYPAESVVFSFSGPSSFTRDAAYSADNEFSYEWDTALSDNGEYEITAISDALSESASSTVLVNNLRVDIVALYSPVAGQVALKAFSSLPADAIFYLIGPQPGRLTAASADRFSHIARWNTELFPDGAYTVKAVATDQDLTAESASAKIEVSNAAKTSAAGSAGTRAETAAKTPSEPEGRGFGPGITFLDFPTEADRDGRLYIAFDPAPDSARFSMTDPSGEENFFDNIVKDSATLYWVYWNPAPLRSGQYIFTAYADLSGKTAQSSTAIRVRNFLDAAGD